MFGLFNKSEPEGIKHASSFFGYFEEGQEAALNGSEFYENPYSHPTNGKREAFKHWFAGWCYGKSLNHKGSAKKGRKK